MLTVLLTGIGAPGTIGTIHSLNNNPAGCPIRIVGVDTNERAVGRTKCVAFAKVPPARDPNYLGTLAHLCEQHNVDVVFPQTTAEVGLLAERRTELEALTRARVCVGSSRSIELANDKGKLLGVFAENGLPHPEFRVVETSQSVEEAALELGYPHVPLIAKPARGNGSRGVVLLSEEVRSYQDFASVKPGIWEMDLRRYGMLTATRTDETIVISEFLPGAEYSADCFVGRTQREFVARRRNLVRSGISFETEIVLNRMVTTTCKAGAAALGLTGLFGFQFKEDANGIPKILECNPRVQGTMVASSLAGANLIWAAVSESAGVGEWAPSRVAEGSVFVRYWGGVALDPSGEVYEVISY